GLGGRNRPALKRNRPDRGHYIRPEEISSAQCPASRFCEDTGKTRKSHASPKSHSARRKKKEIRTGSRLVGQGLSECTGKVSQCRCVRLLDRNPRSRRSGNRKAQGPENSQNDRRNSIPKGPEKIVPAEYRPRGRRAALRVS